MFYQLLVHHKFTKPDVYSVDMEHNRSLITESPAYIENATLIDEYIDLENLFSAIFSTNAKVTKLVSSDRTEQIVQIECTLADSMAFREHPLLPHFMDMRVIVGLDILGCQFSDLSTVTSTTSTYSNFEDARSQFPA